MKNIKMPAGFAAISKAEQVTVSGGFTVRTRVSVGRPGEPKDDDPRRRNEPRRRNNRPQRSAPRARIHINFSFAELFAGVGAIFAIFNPANWFGGFSTTTSTSLLGSSGVDSVKAEYDAIKLF